VELPSYVLVAVGAYLLGSVPTGYLVARARGVDIRSVGSGNIGATNAFRVLGRGPGAFVLAADALKGVLAVFLGALIGPQLADIPAERVDTAVEWFHIVAGVGAIVGHSFTCWLKFKGGKGVATSAGVLLAMLPAAFGIALGVWLVVFLASRYVSLASLAAAAALPVATWWLSPSPPFRGFALLVGALVIVRHRGNIQRLLAGTENRIQWKRDARDDQNRSTT
jgi:glycerol-3-phosphate acyltransferase PlsY